MQYRAEIEYFQLKLSLSHVISLASGKSRAHSRNNKAKEIITFINYHEEIIVSLALVFSELSFFLSLSFCISVSIHSEKRKINRGLRRRII